MDVLSLSTLKGLVGITEKATIYVPSLKGLESWEKAAKAANALTGIGTEEFMQTMQTVGENLIREGARSALSIREMGGMDIAAMGIKEATTEALEGTNTYLKVEVQYNPKSLSLIGLGGEARSYTAGLGMGAENQITQIKNDISTTLSCELIFTDVSVSDAFMTEDLMNLNIESAAGLAASGINRLLGNSPSVQPLVDGFISILTRGFTRKIIFVWGSTVFRGELTRVDAQYRMFNKRGDPIIASINISIRQGFNAKIAGSEKAWRDSFNNTFKNKDDIL